jgi:hypothetical protein
MLRSIDGVNWTTNLLPRDVVLDVAYGNGRYVIAGVSMFSSTNGTDWLPITMQPFYDGFQSVVFAGGKFIATFINVSNPSNAVVHSVDGQNWSLSGSLPIQEHTILFTKMDDLS